MKSTVQFAFQVINGEDGTRSKPMQGTILQIIESIKVAYVDDIANKLDVDHLIILTPVDIDPPEHIMQFALSHPLMLLSSFISHYEENDNV